MSSTSLVHHRTAAVGSMLDRLKKPIPYVIIFLIAGFLYYRANQIGFAVPEGRIGPDAWPKAILGLTMLACLYEVIKNLLLARSEHEISGVLDSITEEAPAENATASVVARLRPRLLIAGIAMTIAYVLLIDKLGFFLCTALYLGCFIWLGGFRRIGVVLVTSLAGALVFMFLFMKVVYISLPLGIEPFANVSYLLMRVMGIH